MREFIKRLKVHGARLKSVSIGDLFEVSPNRGETLNVRSAGMCLDYSKQRIDEPVLRGLIDWANSRELSAAIKALVGGGIVNATENRPALHTSLRTPQIKQVMLNGSDVVGQVHESLHKVAEVVHKVHHRQWRGYSGKAITDVVNVGVGGSDLGPFMVCSALEEFVPEAARSINMHFVSSMDGTQIEQVLKRLNPETTLFIVSSKSFTTVDTFYNANTAIAWLLETVGDRKIVMKQHVVGVSAAPDKMTAWGLPEENQLLFWDWVGGRFSMWSAIGLPIAIKIGMENFYELLAGAHEMDTHFSDASFEQNIPVLLGLIGVWNASFLGIHAHTVLPYDGRLKFLPNYLTQLEMESNGKSVTNGGEPVSLKTCPVLWGDVGPNAQHAFYQLLHQGTQTVSCDFIAPINRYHDSEGKAGNSRQELGRQQMLALANCLAQSRVLAFGDAAVNQEDRPAYKRYRGNQPSSTILLDELNPRTLGALVAAYEHKVYVMATLWDINPFDQWGVELGKVMAGQAMERLTGGQPTVRFDDSTEHLIRMIQANKVPCK